MIAQMISILVALCLLSFCVVHASDLIVRDKDDEIGASSKASKAVKMFNFASQSAGAVILDKSPATAKGYHYLLNDDKDKYGISSCDEKKWVVIGLSEDILITSVEVSNYEKYSSMLKDFQLLASNSYPTDEWINLGTYTAKPQLGSQVFNVTDLSESHTRYLKVKFMTHYSDEALCTLSQIKVYGMTVIASFQQEVQRSDHHTRDVLSHLTADEDVSIREFMENSLREEAQEVHREESHVSAPLETISPNAEPVAPVATEPAEPVNADQTCTEASPEKSNDSRPTLDVAHKDRAESPVLEVLPVVEKQTEGVCASDLTASEEVAEASTAPAATATTAAAVPPAHPNSTTTQQGISDEKAGDEGEVSMTVSVDGDGIWVEPAPSNVDVSAAPTSEAPSESDQAMVDKASDDSLDALVSKSACTSADQCVEVTAPGPDATLHAELPASETVKDNDLIAETVSNNTCTNTEAGKDFVESSSEISADATAEIAAKLRPFDVVVKKIFEGLFATPETAESISEGLHSGTEPAERQELKNDTAAPVDASAHASSSNVSHPAPGNASHPANETAGAHAPHQNITNSSHVVSNVSVFVANATAVEKAHPKADTAVTLPHAGNVTVGNATAHPIATAHVQDHVPVKVTNEHSKTSDEAHASGSHNVTSATPDAHKADPKSNKSAEQNATSEHRPPVASVLPAAVPANKTENATAVPGSTATKTANGTSASSSGHHNSTNSNGTALNCFETLSFAKFSEKMRLKLQQKSSAGSANGSHSGDSAAAAEAAALAAAAGASAKDNNVFRSLMQKIKTLEVDNAIVEMYTIQLSDCYKTVTKELLSRTQAAPSGDQSRKFSGSAPQDGVFHATAEMEHLWRLAPQIVFNYAEAVKLGIVDTFLVLLYRVVEENIVLLVLGSVAAVSVLFFAVLVLACVVLTTKRARPPPLRDEH